MRRVLLAALGLLALLLLLAAPGGGTAPKALFLQAGGAPRLEQRSAYAYAPVAYAPVAYGRVPYRVPVLVMQEEEEAPAPQEGRIEGISGALGGGKTKEQAAADKNPVVVTGSLVAFIAVLAALTFGAVQPDKMDEIAKGFQKPCTADKIVSGKKIVCGPDGKFIRD